MKRHVRSIGLAVLVFTAVMSVACGARTINKVLADPQRYRNREVKLSGSVVDSFSLVGRGAYQIDDTTGRTIASGVEAYGFGGYSYRRGASAGFWRRALDDRTVRSIYPDGFLPFIKSKIIDASLTEGLRGDVHGWKWDLASAYGRNSFAYRIDNSANASIGPSSKTSFNAGQLVFRQSTTTLDLNHDVSTPWYGPVHVALGAEYRKLYDLQFAEEQVTGAIA